MNLWDQSQQKNNAKDGASRKLSGKESTCQTKEKEFDSWSGKIPKTKPLHNYWACALKAGRYNYGSLRALEPVLHKRSHHNEKPAHGSWRAAPDLCS